MPWNIFRIINDLIDLELFLCTCIPVLIDDIQRADLSFCVYIGNNAYVCNISVFKHKMRFVLRYSLALAEYINYLSNQAFSSLSS